MDNNEKIKKAVKFSIEAKPSSKERSARIVVKSKGFYKSIPVIFFTEDEVKTLLKVVDKVEEDTNANIVYKALDE